MTEQEWSKSPYAKSEAKNADASIEKLLAQYAVSDFQWTQARGPHGRKAVMLRFNLQGKTYRIAVEVLDAPKVDETQRVKQAKRAVFWMLKAALEAATVFWTPEQALYAFIELPDGSTAYEASQGFIEGLRAAELLDVLKRHKALPGPAN